MRLSQEASTTSPPRSAARRLLAPARLPIVAVVPLLLVLLATSRAAAQPGTAGDDRPLVTDVSLRGVESVDVTELRDGLATKATSCKTLIYLPLCWVSRGATFTTRRYLDPIEFRRDILRIRLFYWQRGWRDAMVRARTERTSDGVRAIFEIDENEPTRITALRVQQTDSVLPEAAIQRALRLREGDPLDLIAMDSTILLLRDELWERGHAAADIVLDTSQVSDSLNGGPVGLMLAPGPLIRVAAIQVAGNQKVADETIQRLLTFRRGDLFRRSDILDSQRNLYLSGLFTELEVEAPPAGDNQRIVHLRVVEADHNQLEFGGGLTTADFVQLEAAFTRYNFLGSARQLSIRGTLSNLFASTLNGQGIFYDVTEGAPAAERDAFLRPTWSANIDVRQPWLFSPRNQLSASVFTHRHAVPGIVIDRGVGAATALTRSYGPRTNSTLGYTYEVARVDASDVYFCVSFGVCLTSTIQVLSEPNVLSPLAWVTQFDESNDPFTPDRGWRARIDLEHASALTLSDFRYNRMELLGSAYRGISRRAVLAGRIRLGWVGPLASTNEALDVAIPADERVVHPRKRFYAGGSLSVRGFGEQQLGPRVLVVSPTVLTNPRLLDPCTEAELRDRTCNPNRPGVPASAFEPQPLGGTAVAEASIEYRFPLVPAFGIDGAVFLDGALIGTNQLSDLLGATGSVTPGFGVRLGTPVGPVRLDLGVRPTLVERLPVITQVTNPDGSLELVSLATLRSYDPLDATGGFLRQVLSRLRLHLAIGPPF
ncbi:MAG TPA: BamA/TamA family outer membrane protein [Gemmatimonadaceae bacterium]|nr:BamA/TamA family outer membrane protein [Gemmatimonadaceae bacterium]